MQTKYFSSKNIFKEAWSYFTRHIVLLVSASLLYMFLPAAIDQVLRAFSPFLVESSSSSWLLPIRQALSGLTYLLQLWLLVGLSKICLNITNNKPAGFQDFLIPFKVFIRFLGSWFLFCLIVIGGLILLIIPGFIWALKYMFYPYLILDKGLGSVDAIKASAKLTDGVKWQLAGFFFLSILMGIIGVLCLVVGVLVAFPVIFIAQALIYRNLYRQTFGQQPSGSVANEALSN